MGLKYIPKGLNQYYDPRTMQMRDYVVQGLNQAKEYRMAQQVDMCARYVETTEDTVRDSRGGIHTWEQRHYRFCDKKVCPICHERDMKALRKESYGTLLATMEKHPDLVYCFLTLTSALARHRYVMSDSGRLRNDIDKFRKAFASLHHSSMFQKHVEGVFWVLVIKPSKSNDIQAYRTGCVRFNVHLHAVLAVKRESVTGKSFTKTVLATEWQKALGARSRPQIDLFYDIRGYHTAKEEGRAQRKERKRRRARVDLQVVGRQLHAGNGIGCNDNIGRGLSVRCQVHAGPCGHCEGKECQAYCQGPVVHEKSFRLVVKHDCDRHII